MKQTQLVLTAFNNAPIIAIFPTCFISRLLIHEFGHRSPLIFSLLAQMFWNVSYRYQWLGKTWLFLRDLLEAEYKNGWLKIKSVSLLQLDIHSFCEVDFHWKFNFLFCSPMGVFEMAKFESGTKGIMDAVVAATKAGGVSIIGVCRINTNKLKLALTSSTWVKIEMKARGSWRHSLIQTNFLHVFWSRPKKRAKAYSKEFCQVS